MAVVTQPVEVYMTRSLPSSSVLCEMPFECGDSLRPSHTKDLPAQPVPLQAEEKTCLYRIDPSKAVTVAAQLVVFQEGLHWCKYGCNPLGALAAELKLLEGTAVAVLIESQHYKTVVVVGGV